MFITQLKIFTVLLLMVVTANAEYPDPSWATKTPPFIRFDYNWGETIGSSCIPGLVFYNQTYVEDEDIDYMLICYNATLSEDFIYKAYVIKDYNYYNNEYKTNVNICPYQADNSQENVWTESDKEICQLLFLMYCPENKPCYCPEHKPCYDYKI